MKCITYTKNRCATYESTVSDQILLYTYEIRVEHICIHNIFLSIYRERQDSIGYDTEGYNNTIINPDICKRTIIEQNIRHRDTTVYININT